MTKETQEQIACIFCGKSAITSKINWDNFDNWSIDWAVRQIRQMLAGPGRKHKGKNPNTGFPAIKEQGLSIIKMNEDPTYDNIVKAIKQRLLKIVRAYVEAGIITKEELLEQPKEEKPKGKEAKDEEPKEEQTTEEGSS